MELDCPRGSEPSSGCVRILGMRGRHPTLTARDDDERCVLEVWRQSNFRPGTLVTYLQWVRRFRAYCRERCLDEDAQLTGKGARTFCREYVGPRRRGRVCTASQQLALQALHAWAAALGRLGRSLPPWRPPASSRPLPRLLVAYCAYRSSHRGVAPGTLQRDVAVALDFLGGLRKRRRSIATARSVDIDAFIDRLSARLARRTVAGDCSSLRCFLRFLHVTGLLRRDLACCVAAPRIVALDRPPRALPWTDIQRILRCVSHDDPVGRRDYAMLLLMATYGLGAGEVIRLRGRDIDWRSKVLRVRRPKTGVGVELPLLPGVAKTLAEYLQRGRPRHALGDQVFVTKALPHRGLTSGAVRHRVREYARRAGVFADVLGAHIFRHSHATRQIEDCVRPQIVSDILGHRRPSSTSVYIRVALKRLRMVALPVPK